MCAKLRSVKPPAILAAIKMERPIVFPPQSPPTQTSLQPLAVAPREACKLLSVGLSTVYSLMHSGELESYNDGKRLRRITTASIHAYIARQIADSTQQRKQQAAE
jgi:excisionase family DNA binding protein